jgi:hypothetical protein
MRRVFLMIALLRSLVPTADYLETMACLTGF